MRRLSVVISIILLLCLPAAQRSQAQGAAERVYLRPTIETYTPAEKRLFLPYLDEARKAADKGVELLAAGKIDELYQGVHPTLKKLASPEQFREAMEKFEQLSEKPVSYEYRNQALIYPNDSSSMADMSRAQSQVWYAVKSEARKNSNLFLIVKTARIGEKHSIILFDAVNYGGELPPWLRYPNAPNKP
ncbi:MAG: hypothetical protein JO360_11810 [Acidobacteria bacterium]|nr:hypothetical protein [Acidobacteriota bacterium]